MATYVFDPTGLSNGAAVPNASYPWNTPENISIDTTTFGYPVVKESHTSNKEVPLTFTNWPTATDQEVLAKVRSTYQDTASGLDYQNDIVLRGTGTGSTKNGYTVNFLRGSYIVVEGYQSNSSITVGGSYVWLYDPNVWYWMRARVNGNTISFKVWKDGYAEPAGWDWTATDNRLSAAGFAGVGAWSGNGTRYISYISYATAGDTAPGATTVDRSYTPGVARTVSNANIEWQATASMDVGRGTAQGPLDTIAIHWWDDPANNPSMQGVINYFKNTANQVSAHYVVSGTRIVQMVDIANTAWHVLDHNMHTIGIENDPNKPAGTLETIAGLVKFLRTQTGLSLPMLGHQEFSGNSTACPGTYMTDKPTIQTMSTATNVEQYKAKAWNGSSWVAYNTKVYSGSAWGKYKRNVYNNSTWE